MPKEANVSMAESIAVLCFTVFCLFRSRLGCVSELRHLFCSPWTKGKGRMGLAFTLSRPSGPQQQRIVLCSMEYYFIVRSSTLMYSVVPCNTL